MLSWLLVNCNNIENAKPANRSSFISFYEKATNYNAKALELEDDGYIIGGDIQRSTDVYDGVISKINSQGHLVMETSIPDMAINTIKKIPDGYLVLGYKIEANDTSQNLNDRVIKSSLLVKLNQNLEVLGTPLIIKDPSPSAVTVDFEGNALAAYSSDSVILVGTFQAGTQPAQTFLAGIQTNDLTVKWIEKYALLDRNFKNSTAAFIIPKGVVWASGSTRDIQNSQFSYLTIPVVQPRSVFVNFSQYGENENQDYALGNICKSNLGFGVVGTYTDKQSRAQNLYFVRFDIGGNLISGSSVFFDAILSRDNTPLSDKSVSATNEKGLAIASTKDGGYILAGSMTTTTSGGNEDRGNGGEDILLIRLDPFGNILWNKTLGGSGNEEVRAIYETAEGDFVLCGNSSLSNLSSIFLMRTNSHGDIDK
jgi:hypothetical protein